MADARALEQVLVPVIVIGGNMLFGYPMIKRLAETEGWGLEDYITAVHLGLLVFSSGKALTNVISQIRRGFGRTATMVRPRRRKMRNRHTIRRRVRNRLY